MNKIFLTVDVECHDYNMQNQYLWGRLGNEEYGLKLILDLGKELNIPINFFVDFAECNRYGKDFILRIVNLIKSYHQGIYLHLHPNFISGDDSRTFLWQYTYEEQQEILRIGLENYKNIMERDDCPAFRIGRYGANHDMYKAMKELNMHTVDFSYCFDCPKMCRSSYSELQTFNRPIKYENQMIFPNTSYIGFKLFNWKKAFIMDVSEATFYEFKKLLKMNTLENITCTMHSWNFIKKYFFSKKLLFGNTYEIRKFKKLVDYIKKSGYIFCDIEKDFDRDTAYTKDEIIDLCKGTKNLLTSYLSNFFRFQQIARLNKKYFCIYLLFYIMMLIFIFTILW